MGISPFEDAVRQIEKNEEFAEEFAEEIKLCIENIIKSIEPKSWKGFGGIAQGEHDMNIQEHSYRISGQEMAKDRKQIAHRGVNVVCSHNIDWEECDLLITVVPKTLKPYVSEVFFGRQGKSLHYPKP